MSQLTKAQLLSELEVARIELQRLAAENESLKARLDTGIAAFKELRAAHIALQAKQQRGPFPHRRVLPARTPTPEQEAAHAEYVSALNAAREAAIRTGRSVRLG